MTEGRTREIQLTGKQLVFVFMSTLLVAVVVFLLGVWVGRGMGDPVTSGPAAADAGADSDTMVAAKGVTEPGKLSYPNVLQGPAPGAGSGGATGRSQPTVPPPTAAAPPTPLPPAARPETSKPSAPKPEASKPPAPKPDTSKPTLPPGSATGWVVQVGAFSSKANAEGLASALRARKYPALVVSSSPGPQFKVRVGPFPGRSEAEQARARLAKEKGVEKPSVINTR